MSLIGIALQLSILTSLAVEPNDTLVYVGNIGAIGAGANQYQAPSGLALDGQGRLLIMDGQGNKILVYTTDGDYVTQWGTTGADPGQFDGPIDALLDHDNNVYVTEGRNYRMQVFDDNRQFIRMYDVPGSGGYIAINPAKSAIYMNSGPYVFMFSTLGDSIGKWQYAINTPFATPYAFDTGPDGSVYLSDDDEVAVFDSSGAPRNRWGGFTYASAVAVSPSGYVYAADAGKIKVFRNNGSLLASWGREGTGTGEISGQCEDILVTDSAVFLITHGEVLKFGRDPTPTRKTTWGRLKGKYR